MGFLDPFTDGVSVMSGGLSRPSNHRRHSSRSRHKKHRSKSRSRSRSRSSSRHRSKSNAGSFFGLGDSHYKKHNSSRGSFFGLGNASHSSFFGMSKPSYYKRSPRQGFMARAYKQLKRILRKLIHHAKHNPFKVIFFVLMPLVTGGALTALLARFGLRLPPSLERLLGVASRAASGDSVGLVTDAVRMATDFGARGGSGSFHVDRGRDGNMQWERKSSSSRDNGWGGNIMGMAKMFI